MIISLCLIVFAILMCFDLYKRKCNRIGRMIDRLPGPFSFPVVGTILTLNLEEENIFLKFRELIETYYPIYRIWNLHIAFVGLGHPDHMEVILSNSKLSKRAHFYEYLVPWLGRGMLTANEPQIFKQRKTLTPAFHFDILKQFVDSFMEYSQYYVDMIKEEGQGGPIVKDVKELMGEFTLRMICETAMGVPIEGGKTQLITEYEEAAQYISQTAFYRFVRPWFHFDFLFKLSKRGQKQMKSLTILHNFSKNIIAQRKRYHESTGGKYLQDSEKLDKSFTNSGTNNNGNHDCNTVHKRRLPLLDLLLSISREINELSDKQILDEVISFIFGGHDTTATALCYALLLFAKHQDVQERIRQEVKEIMEKGEKLTTSDIQNWSYLERCLKESLRLYPSIPLIVRTLKEDCQVGEYKLPAGAMCVMHIYDMHRNPAFWPNPLVFDPDRFLPENIKNRHPYSYIPFSAGVRNCMGQKYAMLQMKVFVAFILHNFILEPVIELDDVRMEVDLVLRAAHPLPVKFVPLR